MGRKRLSLLAGLLLAGCAGWPQAPEAVRSGDELRQRTELSVPAADQRLWVQEGRLGVTSLVAWRNPYCEIRFGPEASAGQVISAGRYTVTAVRSETLIGAGLPYQVAGLLSAAERGDGAEHALFRVILELAPANAGLSALVCAQRDDLRDGRYPSREQINETLGRHFSLLPGQGA